MSWFFTLFISLFSSLIALCVRYNTTDVLTFNVCMYVDSMTMYVVIGGHYKWPLVAVGLTYVMNILLEMLLRCPRYLSQGPAELMWSVVHFW